MWLRTLTTVDFGKMQIAANSRIEVQDHIGRILIRLNKAERVYELTEAEIAAVLEPDKANAGSLQYA